MHQNLMLTNLPNQGNDRCFQWPISKGNHFRSEIHQINVQTRSKDNFSETQSENHLLRTNELSDLIWRTRTRYYPGNDDSVNQSDCKIMAHAHTGAYSRRPLP
jgi:hypothetical protein